MLEFLYDVLFQPWQAMRRIGSEARLPQAGVAFLLGVTLPIIGMYVSLQHTPVSRFFEGMIAAQICGSALLWFLSAAVWHLVAEMLGGSGRAVDLFTALGFAYLPRIFILPIGVGASVMPMGSYEIWLGLFGMVIAFWTLYLNVLAISGVHNVSRLRAFMVLLMPLIVLSAFFMVLILIFGLSMLQMPWLQGA